MKRLMDYYLNTWKNDPYRKPLLLRGARQIGKTFSVRELGKSFAECVEINFELFPEANLVFEKDLQPERIIRELSLIAKKPIQSGKTLLFFDEVQVVPKTLIALRYFYEMMPELHVIATGAELDLAIEEVGAPVGRAQLLYMYPLSFIEFLAAVDESLLVEEILAYTNNQEIVSKAKLMCLLREYLVISGMPEAVIQLIATKNSLCCAQNNLLVDFVNQRSLILAFLGKEVLAYDYPWLGKHQKSPYRTKFSTQNYSEFERVKSYPLYAVSEVISEGDEMVKNAISFLIKK